MNLMLLKVKSFRNIKESVIEFSDRINVITGLNSAGKTNLIEAAGLILTGSSIRRARNIEMIRFDKDEAYIKGIYKNGEVKHCSEASIYHNGKRFSLDGKFIKSTRELTGKNKSLFFSNTDLLFFTGGPEFRRRIIAELLIRYEPHYADVSSRYGKVLKARNIALKNGCRDDEKRVWDEKLVETGIEAVKFKEKFLRLLNNKLNDIMYEVFNLKDSFFVRYISDVSERSSFLQRIKEVENQERYLKTTLTGPQRDDFVPEINGIDIRKFGSSGECKSFLIGVKLSACRLIKERYGIMPVFIIDDFDSKIDTKRGEKLINFLASEEGQVFLTTPSDKINFRGFKNVLKIVNGTVYTEGSAKYV